VRSNFVINHLSHDLINGMRLQVAEGIVQGRLGGVVHDGFDGPTRGHTSDQTDEIACSQKMISGLQGLWLKIVDDDMPEWEPIYFQRVPGCLFPYHRNLVAKDLVPIIPHKEYRSSLA
jgi:hypothetical protein